MHSAASALAVDGRAYCKSNRAQIKTHAATESCQQPRRQSSSSRLAKRSPPSCKTQAHPGPHAPTAPHLPIPPKAFPQPRPRGVARAVAAHLAEAIVLRRHWSDIRWLQVREGHSIGRSQSMEKSSEPQSPSAVRGPASSKQYADMEKSSSSAKVPGTAAQMAKGSALTCDLMQQGSSGSPPGRSCRREAGGFGTASRSRICVRIVGNRTARVVGCCDEDDEASCEKFEPPRSRHRTIGRHMAHTHTHTHNDWTAVAQGQSRRLTVRRPAAAAGASHHRTRRADGTVKQVQKRTPPSRLR